MGDAVYEQLVREKLLLTANTSAKNLHDEAVRRVRAAYQAKAAELIADIVTEDEANIMRRGRNATGNGWHVPKSSDRAEYSRATSLEALFGWLHLLGDRERITQLFEYIWERNDLQ
ncbi:MAG: Mini-ribonuclease 3 [Oscillospiraceae bacterium]